MRAALYGRHLGRQVRTGIEVYAEGIIGHLLEMDGDWVVLYPAGASSWHKASSHRRQAMLRSSSSLLPLAGEIGCMLKHEKCDVFYNPGQYAPLSSPCPVVATALDVAWRYYPDYFPLAKRIGFDCLTRHACRSADRIIAISQSTCRDLVEIYRCPPGKIVVAYPGINHELFNPVLSNDDAVLRRYGLKMGGYILFLGTLQKRKNLIRLIGAFGRMKGTSLPLVLAGGQGWFYKEIAEAIARSPRRAEIVETGYVEALERPALYRNAACTAYVSLYEGFGFPVAEAMACGCPAVVSTASSLPEITGDVGWRVDPLNEEEMTIALEQAAAVGMEPGLRAAACARAQIFDWRRSAEIVHAALRSSSMR